MAEKNPPPWQGCLILIVIAFAALFLLSLCIGQDPAEAPPSRERMQASDTAPAPQEVKRGLGFSVRDYEAQLAELDLDIDLQYSPLGEGMPRWIGNAGVVIVELQGPRSDLTSIYVMAGFVKDDLGATAESLLWLTTVIAAVLPLEERKPVADWMLAQIGKVESIPEDGQAETSYTAGDLQFKWTFMPILGSASLSVERLPGR